MIKIIFRCLFIFFIYSPVIAQTEQDTLNSEDSIKINFEYLLEQITDEEESQALDLFEVEPPISKERTFWSIPSFSVRLRVIQKLQTAKGYQTGKYLGSPLKSYQRIKINQGKNITAGFLADKDYGERYLNDFMNGFIQLKDVGLVSNILLGDYVVEAGQGLVFWRGYDFQKGANIEAGTIRKGRELKPYLSSDENGYLRGAAVSLKHSNLSLALFYSQKKLGASVDTSNFVTSIYTTGYYRTESEISKQGNVREILFGGRCVYDFRSLVKLGLTYSNSEFSKNLKIGGGNKFEGNFYSAAGFDYQINFNKIDLFGEIALSSLKKFSNVLGLSIKPSRMVKVISLYRNYSEKYFARYANPFGESYGGSNEVGYYLGVELKPVKKIEIVGYFDQFKFPGQTSVNYPRKGTELFLQTDYKVLRNLLISIRYKEKKSDVNAKITDEFNRDVRIIDRQDKRVYRLNVDYKLSKAIKLRWRFEYLELIWELSKKREDGRTIYQDIQIKGSDNLTIYCRLNYFNTDSYSSGIYQYENDLPGVLTIPPLYGKGVKWYILINYKLFQSFDVSVKYSNLIRDDVKKIGSGWDELPSNIDNRIGIQLDFKF